MTAQPIPYQLGEPPTDARIEARTIASRILTRQGTPLDGWQILQIERILHLGADDTDREWLR